MAAKRKHEDIFDLDEPSKKQTAHTFSDLCTDTINDIVLFMDTKTFINFSYTCKEYNQYKHQHELTQNKVKKVNCKSGQLLTNLRRANGTISHIDIFMESEIDVENIEPRDADLRACCQNTVRVLKLSYTTKISGLYFSYIANTLQVLEITNITNFKEQYLAELINLKSLQVKMTDHKNIRGYFLQKIGGGLEKFIMHAPNFDSDNLKYLTKVKKLDLLYNNMQSAHFLQVNPALQYLTISFTSNPMDDVVKHFGSSLKSLISVNCNITDHCAQYLKVIETLYITRNSYITSHFFKSLPKIPTDLSVATSMKVDDKFFEYIRGKAKHLTIRGCTQLSQSAMATVVPYLTFFNFEDCNLKPLEKYRHKLLVYTAKSQALSKDSNDNNQLILESIPPRQKLIKFNVPSLFFDNAEHLDKFKIRVATIQDRSGENSKNVFMLGKTSKHFFMLDAKIYGYYYDGRCTQLPT